jgi:MFS family permease
VAFAAGVAAWGLAVLSMAAWPTPDVAWVVLAAVGLGNALEDVAGLTLLQRLVPERHLGRAFGALWGIAAAGLAAGSIVAPMLIAGFGLRWAMALSGAGLLVLVAALWGQVGHSNLRARQRVDARFRLV